MAHPLAIEIVPLQDDMLDACAAIAATAPDPWRRTAFERVLAHENQLCLVALQNGKPVGFASFLLVCGTADLQLVAVDEACRRAGVAHRLLQAALHTLAKRGAEQVLLEVRASNTSAIALYRGLGFTVLAPRPGLYAHPKEDGLLMALAIKQPEKKANE